ncbi:hypothetical protein BU17DRAFT_89721 [Hysterangium stoloniferum]|nr:hypothetical protein BU17DRAFT_89721 [Hysterangium stoloniferum]
MTFSLILLLTALSSANAFFLMSVNTLVYERRDPIVSPGAISSHTHIITGGSDFGATVTTAQLRQSRCTSTPIAQDKSNYWTESMYFQWKNGSFTSSANILNLTTTSSYYLYPSNVPAGTVTAFPDDFRMISGDPTLRTYNASSFAQQAISFLCLDFNGASTKHTGLPVGVSCPSGIRAQINFPSCWDGKNVDSANHKSHVAFPSGGPDSGSCSDPKFPVTLPRIFIEVYWGTNNFNAQEAMNPQQPFVLAQGDGTGYGHHADYFNGWAPGVLQNVVDKCTCPQFGDPTCCSQQGIFDYNSAGNQCTINSDTSEQVLGTLDKLPGNNPVTGLSRGASVTIRVPRSLQPP